VAAEDTEITLGMGKLLGLFFMLALTCGLFFAVGYSLGKTSAREQALKNQTSSTETAAADVDNGKSAVAPNANTPSSKQTPESPKEPSPDLTFYKAVKEDPRVKASTAQSQKPSDAATADNKKDASPTTNEPPAENSSATDKKTAAASAASTQSSPQASAGRTYLVQIAAVSHEEDAAALAGALRKKSYGASVVTNPTGKDKLFHVVLGPYASLQDAQAMKSKLEGEGYSPIVKR
jgi:cell division septation protein DedD